MSFSLVDRYTNNLTCTKKANCLCTPCVVAHELKYTKQTLRTDCDDCYVQYCPVLLEYVEHFCGEHVPAPPPKAVHKNKADEGTEYAFTLTMPPGYATSEKIEAAAKKILQNGLTPSKPYEKACYGAYVVETTEVGTPHVHGVYKTPSGRRISAKYFKRYWDLWDEKIKMGHGHKGGYHAKARHTESYEAYMEKEGVKIPVQSPEIKSQEEV